MLYATCRRLRYTLHAVGYALRYAALRYVTIVPLRYSIRYARLGYLTSRYLHSFIRSGSCMRVYVLVRTHIHGHKL